MTLWQYACNLYAQEGVELSLLQLQDKHGLIINHLLAGCWAEKNNMSINWCALLLKERHTKFCTAVIEPIRMFRREQKSKVLDEPLSLIHI